MHRKLSEYCVQAIEQLLPLLQDTGLENLIYFSDEATFRVDNARLNQI